MMLKFRIEPQVVLGHSTILTANLKISLNKVRKTRSSDVYLLCQKSDQTLDFDQLPKAFEVRTSQNCKR